MFWFVCLFLFFPQSCLFCYVVVVFFCKLTLGSEATQGLVKGLKEFVDGFWDSGIVVYLIRRKNESSIQYLIPCLTLSLLQNNSSKNNLISQLN